MTHGPGPGADEFARIRMARHRTYRRRFALVAVVLVLVGAVTAGVLVAYGLGGEPEPERDADGRLVPPSALVVDDDVARALVVEGRWPEGRSLDGMPMGDADRLGWLLTEVGWEDDEADVLGRAVGTAVVDEADLAVALVAGVAGASRPLLDHLREPVARALANRQRAVTASLAGLEPPAEEPRLDVEQLTDTLAAVGLEEVAPLEDLLVAGMRQGWRRSLPAAGRDASGAVDRFVDGYPEEFLRWARPVVLLYAGAARELCADDPEGCEEQLGRRTARADEVFAALVLDSIPRELLPDAVQRDLGADRAAHRRLSPAADAAWERFRQQQGYGITRPVADALAG